MLKGQYTIGLMSGTSMDGIDGAIIDANNKFVYGHTYPFPEATKHKLIDLMRHPVVHLSELMTLHQHLGDLFASATLSLIEASKIHFDEIACIGSHGQTILHEPNFTPPHTIQLGCPHVIAYKTGLPVIADFRTRDMIDHGQGAPFAPWYHQQIFGKQTRNYCVVNIGGIANLSYFTPNGQISGFDTGPGNCLIDEWCAKTLNKPYDDNGDFARSGQVDKNLLANLLSDSFFNCLPPKSIGREYFSLAWLQSALIGHENAKNIQATLVELTAKTIIDAVENRMPSAHEIILCGGGVHNGFLVERIQALAPQRRVLSSAVFGVNPDFLEAMMFAWFARQFIETQPVDLSLITGCQHKKLLGVYYPA